MTLGTLEILALILIAIAAIKLIVFLVSPQSWYSFLQKLYVNPQITSVVALLLAAIVLYLLIASGITIVEILAICLFIVLLMAVGIAKYADQIIGWTEQQEVVSFVRKLWLYTIVWVLLLAWGVGEILFN